LHHIAHAGGQQAHKYLAVKLFSKYSNLCEIIPQRDTQTDRRLSVA